MQTKTKVALILLLLCLLLTACVANSGVVIKKDWNLTIMGGPVYFVWIKPAKYGSVKIKVTESVYNQVVVGQCYTFTNGGTTANPCY